MARDPERRTSLDTDRRRAPRGGRRRGDQPVAYPSSFLPCPVCLVGVADIVAVAPDGNTRTLTYQCADCDRQFEQNADPLIS
jgi:hypothetical protein